MKANISINYYYQLHVRCFELINQLLQPSLSSSTSKSRNSYRINILKSYILFSLTLLVYINASESNSNIIWDSMQMNIMQCIRIYAEELMQLENTVDTDDWVVLFMNPVYRYIADIYSSKFMSISNIDYYKYDTVSLIPLDMVKNDGNIQKKCTYVSIMGYNSNMKGIGIKYDDDNVSICTSTNYFMSCIRCYIKCIDKLKHCEHDVFMTYPYPTVDMVNIQQYLLQSEDIKKKRNVFIKHPLSVYCTNDAYFHCSQCSKQQQSNHVISKESVPILILRYYKDIMECYYQLGLTSSSYCVAMDTYCSAVFYYEECKSFSKIHKLIIDVTSQVLLLDIKYHLADSYFHLGRYNDCLSELDDILGLVDWIKSSKVNLSNRLVHVYTLLVNTNSRIGKLEIALKFVQILESIPTHTAHASLGPVGISKMNADSVSVQIKQLKQTVLKQIQDRDRVKHEVHLSSSLTSNNNKAIINKVESCLVEPAAVKMDTGEIALNQVTYYNEKDVQLNVKDTENAIPLKYVDKNLYVAYGVLITSAIVIGASILYSVMLKYS